MSEHVTLFQQLALGLTAVWLALAGIAFRTSRIFLAGGLIGLGLYAMAAVLSGAATLKTLGLNSGFMDKHVRIRWGLACINAGRQSCR